MEMLSKVFPSQDEAEISYIISRIEVRPRIVCPFKMIRHGLVIEPSILKVNLVDNLGDSCTVYRLSWFEEPISIIWRVAGVIC